MAADATQLVEMPEVAEAAAAEASPRGPAPAPLPPSAVSPERSTLLGPRLLVVDDDPALVDYVATALQSTLAAFVPATTFDEVRRARDVDAAIVSLPFGSPDRCEETVATLRAVHSRLPVALLEDRRELLGLLHEQARAGSSKVLDARAWVDGSREMSTLH